MIILDNIFQVLFGVFLMYLFSYQIYWAYIVSPKFDGKTVFITGASSGIGECLAKTFTKLWVKRLILAARRLD